MRRGHWMCDECGRSFCVTHTETANHAEARVNPDKVFLLCDGCRKRHLAPGIIEQFFPQIRQEERRAGKDHKKNPA